MRARVIVELHDNTHTMLTYQRHRGVWQLRLHHMFVAAPTEVLEALAVFVRTGDAQASATLDAYIEGNKVFIRRVPPSQLRRRLRIDPVGEHHDLKEIFDELNRRYFRNRINATITYGPGEQAQARTTAAALGLPASHLTQGSASGVVLVIGSDWPSGTSYGGAGDSGGSSDGTGGSGSSTDTHAAVADAHAQTADKAKSFVQNSAEKWKGCAGKTVTVTNKSKTYRWTFAQVQGGPPKVTLMDTQEGADGWECQRALSVANNVVVDINACGYHISDQGGQIADKILAKIDSEKPEG